jgi:hypothetical protein
MKDTTQLRATLAPIVSQLRTTTKGVAAAIVLDWQRPSDDTLDDFVEHLTEETLRRLAQLALDRALIV